MDPSMYSMVLMVVLFIAIFYFMVFRPNKKQQDAHKKLIESLHPNVKVVTVGGIHGTVARVNDTTVTVKVSDRTEIEFSKDAIRTVDSTEGAVAVASTSSAAAKTTQDFGDDDEDFMTDEEIAEKKRKKKQKREVAKEEI